MSTPRVDDDDGQEDLVVAGYSLNSVLSLYLLLPTHRMESGRQTNRHSPLTKDPWELSTISYLKWWTAAAVVVSVGRGPGFVKLFCQEKSF